VLQALAYPKVRKAVRGKAAASAAVTDRTPQDVAADEFYYFQ
jgi:hypothetical protein